MNSFEMYDPNNGKRQKYSLQETQTQPQQMQNTQRPTYSSQDIRSNKYLGGLINNTNNVLDKTYNQVAERKSYDMPSINHSLLTNKGFNEALNRVQATNRMKLDEKRRSALTNMFSSTMSGRNNLISNATNEQNNRRTIANSAFQAGQGRLEREKIQNDRLAQQQQQYNRTHDFEMQKYLHPISSTDNTQKYIMERTKAFTKNPTSFIPDWDNLDSNQKQQAMQQYVNNGTVAKVNIQDHFLGNDYSLAQPQTQQQQPQQYDAQKVVGNKRYVYKNGKWFLP